MMGIDPLLLLYSMRKGAGELLSSRNREFFCSKFGVSKAGLDPNFPSNLDFYDVLSSLPTWARLCCSASSRLSTLIDFLFFALPCRISVISDLSVWMIACELSM